MKILSLSREIVLKREPRNHSAMTNLFIYKIIKKIKLTMSLQ